VSSRFLAGGYEAYLTVSDNPKLRFEQIPNVSVNYNGHVRRIPDAPFQLNAEGFRDSDHAAAKPAGVYRIIGLGDTEMSGFGVPFAATKLQQLESMLNRGATTRAVETLNLGVAAYNMTQFVELLRLKGVRYQPDAVVFALAQNDLDVPARLDDFILKKGPVLLFLFWRVPLARFAIQRVHYRQIFSTETAMDKVSAALDELYAMADVGDFTVVWAPVNMLEGDAWRQFEQRIALTDSLYVQIPGYRLDEDSHIPDDWHLNEKGNRIWAEETACAMLRANVLPADVAAKMEKTLNCVSSAMPPPPVNPPGAGEEGRFNAEGG
ncbi:MAG: hypothetical protein ACTSXZ_07905, partial [Alphaproteobacteria bacterium]